MGNRMMCITTPNKGGVQVDPTRTYLCFCRRRPNLTFGSALTGAILPEPM